MSEFRDRITSRGVKLVIAPLAATALMSVGCDSQNQETATTIQTLTVVPNFSKLTKGGASCEQGYARPCFQPLYKSPREQRPLKTTDIVNAFTQTTGGIRVDGPYESYHNPPNEPAGSVEIVCQVRGQSIHNAYEQNTTVWDVIRWPSGQVNHAASVEAKSHNPGFGVEKSTNGTVEAVYAYASSMWLGDSIDLNLPICNHTENPGDYAPVH